MVPSMARREQRVLPTVRPRRPGIRRGLVLPALLGGGALLAACSAATPPTTTPAPSVAAPANSSVATASVAVAPSARPSPAPTARVTLVSPDPSAKLSDVAIKVVSFHVAFSPTTLTVPVDRRWKLTLELQDPLGHHNFTLSSGPSVAERVFHTPTVGVGTYEYVVPGLPAGTYTFVCTLHSDTMKGTVEVK